MWTVIILMENRRLRCSIFPPIKYSFPSRIYNQFPTTSCVFSFIITLCCKKSEVEVSRAYRHTDLHVYFTAILVWRSIVKLLGSTWYVYFLILTLYGQKHSNPMVYDLSHSSKLLIRRNPVNLRLISHYISCYKPVGLTGQNCLPKHKKFTLIQHTSVTNYEK